MEHLADGISEGVDIRVRVTGGGHTSQVYAIRQAIAKSIVRSTRNHFAKDEEDLETHG